MKFDTIIAGGGLAGLVCAIRLSEAGQRCAVISRGQSALHFSSGSLDLLSVLPDGTPVEDIRQGLEALTIQAPDHPYVRVGIDKVVDYARQTEALLARCQLKMQGSWQVAHQRITPFGTRRAAWLSPPEAPVLPLGWSQLTLVGIAGFMDFQPHLAAASLARQGFQVTTAELTLPALDALRRNPSEFRAVNIARLLDSGSERQQLIQALQRLALETDALLLPACFGLEDDALFRELQAELPCALYLLPTLPPSVPGMRLHRTLVHRYRQLGGTLMQGDEVTAASRNAAGEFAVSTRNHGDIALRAPYLVLASGSFFSNGLIAGRDGPREAICHLDLTESQWRSDDAPQSFFQPQPWHQCGVRVNEQLQPTRDGIRIPGLYAIGSLLGGYDPVRQGCGGGVCAITALHAAQQILNATGESHENLR